MKHDCLREMKRWASGETSLERLPQTTMGKLYSTDDCPRDSYVFSYCGCDLPIRSERAADAFVWFLVPKIRKYYDSEQGSGSLRSGRTQKTKRNKPIKTAEVKV